MEVDAHSGAENVPPANVAAAGAIDPKRSFGGAPPTMGSLDRGVETLLAETRDPSRVHAAEAALKQLEGQAGFASHLLRICHPSAPNTGVQLQAATYFRNLVRNRWTASQVSCCNTNTVDGSD